MTKRQCVTQAPDDESLFCLSLEILCVYLFSGCLLGIVQSILIVYKMANVPKLYMWSSNRFRTNGLAGIFPCRQMMPRGDNSLSPVISTA